VDVICVLGCSGCFVSMVPLFFMVVKVLMFKIVSKVSWVVVLVLLGDF